MEIALRQKDGVTIADLEGRLVLGDGEAALRALVERLITEGRLRVLVRLAGVSAIDSSGVGELVAAKKDIEGLGGRLKLLDARGAVGRVLETSLLLPAFEHFTDEAEAVRSFR